MTTPVRDARPPSAALAVLNPIMKVLLRTPASRALPQLALLDFQGRRSGRHLSVVVGWHAVHGGALVFSPAGWRASFAGGRLATVRWRGRRHDHLGTLELDPAAVAGAIDAVIRGGTSPKALGLRVPTGHTITGADVVATGRGMVRFRPVPDDHGG